MDASEVSSQSEFSQVMEFEFKSFFASAGARKSDKEGEKARSIGRGDAEAVVKRKLEGSSRENVELVGVPSPDFQGLPTGNPWRLCMGGKLKRK